ncbi:apelin receptor [Protopterus annectens]|uniref:apelin receptor n=1 Tax=Protopterus annectens TaxID=7888 RepID=UPI001CF9731D|nr:apelin receptor [Protopterus annectens]
MSSTGQIREVISSTESMTDKYPVSNLTDIDMDMEYEEDNGTDCILQEWQVTYTLIPIIYFMVFFLGLSGNGLVIWINLHNKEKRRSADNFIVNLAVADLTFVLTLPLWAVYTGLDYHWPFGSFTCRVSSYIVFVNMYASVFCLTGLSFDRFLAIVYSLNSGRLRSKASGLPGTIFIWGLASLLALPAIIFRNTIYSTEVNGTILCDMDFSSVADNHRVISWRAGLSLSSTIFGFIIPFVVMVTCYYSIAHTISRHFQDQKQEGQRKRRLLSIIITLVMVFGICWLPYHLSKTINILLDLEVITVSCETENFLFKIHHYVTSIAYINSCLNPFLYAFFDPRFRAECLLLLTCGDLQSLQDKFANLSSSHSLNGKCEQQTLPSRL